MGKMKTILLFLLFGLSVQAQMAPLPTMDNPIVQSPKGASQIVIATAQPNPTTETNIIITVSPASWTDLQVSTNMVTWNDCGPFYSQTNFPLPSLPAGFYRGIPAVQVGWSPVAETNVTNYVLFQSDSLVGFKRIASTSTTNIIVNLTGSTNYIAISSSDGTLLSPLSSPVSIPKTNGTVTINLQTSN